MCVCVCACVRVYMHTHMRACICALWAHKIQDVMTSRLITVFAAEDLL